jgi:hypothetical protein
VHRVGIGHEGCFVLAEALAQEMTARGAQPLLLRRRQDGPSDPVRARAANDAHASLVVAMLAGTKFLREDGSELIPEWVR